VGASKGSFFIITLNRGKLVDVRLEIDAIRG
jgi:hypothetical protein